MRSNRNATDGRCNQPGWRCLEATVQRLRGRDWLEMPAKRQDELVDLCFSYWRARGFPHYRLSTAEIATEYSRLAILDSRRVFTGPELRGSPVGLRLANYFHPQMWSVPMPGVRSPMERFADDEILRKLIRKALHVFPERFAVNENNLRRMLQTYSRTARVSNFRATAAKAIYERYSGCGDTVVDFSSGFGGRLLGCLTLERQYLGIDPCTAQVTGLRRMLSELVALALPVGRAVIEQACAEDLLPRVRRSSCSLVFSSPPYFNNERYSTEPTQSYIRFPSYDQWVRGFLEPVIEEAYRILDYGGFFVVNVANVNGFTLADDAFQIATRNFTHRETCELRLGQRPYLRTAGFDIHRREPLFVFQKRQVRRFAKVA